MKKLMLLCMTLLTSTGLAQTETKPGIMTAVETDFTGLVGLNLRF